MPSGDKAMVAVPELKKHTRITKASQAIKTENAREGAKREHEVSRELEF